MLSGELEVLGAIAGSHIVIPIQPGEITGDVAVIAKVPYKATARARIPTTALFIAADALRELIENDLGVASAMLHNVSLRVLQLVESLETA